MHYDTNQPPAKWANPSLRERWQTRYKSGYFDGASKTLRPEFVQRSCVQPLVEELAHPPKPLPQLTQHQVRRFFQHCRWIERQLRTRAKSWEEMRVEVLKLAVAAADAFGKRPTPKIPESFRDFIQWNVDQTQTAEDFTNGFLPHFEAVIGFGSGVFSDRA
jgi:CRISPR type III-A-associated protein Csm2